jgi:hypothetical protein
LRRISTLRTASAAATTATATPRPTIVFASLAIARCGSRRRIELSGVGGVVVQEFEGVGYSAVEFAISLRRCFTRFPAIVTRFLFLAFRRTRPIPFGSCFRSPGSFVARF